MEVTEEKQGKTSLLRKWVDMVELRRLLALMLPLYIANLMHIGMGVIDTIVAGVAGPVELAAVALGTSVCAPIMVAVGAVLTIVGPMVSRMRGAGTERQIGLLLNNAKVLALILMVVEAAALYGGLYIFPLVTNDPVLAEKAAQYVWYMILGVPASVLLRAVGGYFEGYGQTRPAMVLSLGGLLLNVPLNYVLVLGKWGMPALGGAGCGLATAIIHWMMLAGLVLLMFVGACAGSTGGGIKVSRIVMLVKTVARELYSYIHPKSIRSSKMDGKSLDRETVHSVCVYLATFVVLFSASLFIVSLEGRDLVTTFTAVTATINNIGPGLELVGPAGNFSMLSGLSKWTLIFDMLAGRLELFPLLILFHPTVWKEMYSRRKINE
jgi:Na+-driven multidrug efflux pump